MKIFLIDNDINGLLSGLFVSFTEKIYPDQVWDKTVYQPRLDAIGINVEKDTAKAERVKKALYSYGGNDVIAHLRVCLSSCSPQALSTAFFYAHYMLEKRCDVSEHMNDKRVSDFSYTVQKVLHERHIMTGFLRFMQSSNGVMYAPYEPDNDITSLLAPHFLRRLGITPFVIHDVKRNKVAVSNGKTIRILQTNLPPNFCPSDNEQHFSLLYKKYFKHVNITERPHKKQQDSYFPRRYRKYCFETWEH